MKSSRDPNLMHPDLRERMALAFVDYKKDYPNEYQPFLTDIYRDQADQTRAYQDKKTNAKWGQSLHNYIPTAACDIAFKTPSGAASYVHSHFIRFAPYAKKYGLNWGGDWTSQDMPHFELPATWQEIKAGKYPKMPPISNPYLEMAQEAEALYKSGKISSGELIVFLQVLIKLKNGN